MQRPMKFLNHDCNRRFVLRVIAISLLWIGGIPRASNGQSAGFKPRTYALTGGKVVSPNLPHPQSLTVIVRDGVIVVVANDAAVPGDARKIDVTGLTVYPGLIDGGSSAFLDSEKAPKAAQSKEVEFDKYILAATRRDNRKGLTPSFRAVDTLKLDAGGLDGFRKLGFTSAHVMPSGRIASGTGASIQMGAQVTADAILIADTWNHLKLHAPSGSYPATLMGCTAHLRQAFLDAQHYVAHWNAFRKSNAKVTTRPRVDQDLQALAEILSGKRKVVFETSSNDDIHRALDFADEFTLKPALLIRGDYSRAIDRIIKSKVVVLLAQDFGGKPKIETPTNADKLTIDLKPPRRVQQDQIDTWSKNFALLNRLFKSGVPVALGSFGSNNPQFVIRNIQTAAKNGVPVNLLLKSVTSTPAELVGLGDRLGAIQVGKLAHLTVLTGPLEDERSKVRHVFVEQSHYEFNTNAKPVVPESSLAKNADVAGKWNLQIEGSSEKLIAVVEFSQDKDRLSGHFKSDRGNGKLSSGKVVDQKVEFAVAIGAGARSVELQFKGTLAKGSLNGKLRSAFGAETAWSAKRQPPAIVKNPVAIGSIESVDSKAASPKKTDDKDQPSELESDRLAVQTMTGGNLLIKSATVFTGTRKTLSNTCIRIAKGKIVEIGPNVSAPKGVKVIDAKGRFVVPGLMDTHSHIMIQSGVNESTQSVVCEVGIKDVINSQDVAEYRALAGGLTTARLLHGSANVIGGQDAVVKLKYGKTAREHLVPKHPLGVKFALGENVKFRTSRFPNTRLGVEATLQRAFLEAIDYRRHWFQYERGGRKGLAPRRDLRLEALVKIVEHEMFIHCHCYRADELLMLLRVASQHGFRIQSLQHVLEGYKVAPEIVAHGASCSTFADWWAYKVEAFDATPYNAALLHEAGANVVIKSDDAELIRHMYYEAAKPIRYGGLSPDAALQTITLNSARELQLTDRLGSIEVGKDGDLAIFNGHPFDSFSRCEMTIIEGDIYFQRDKAPTAITKAGRASIGKRPAFSIPSAKARSKQVDVSKIKDGNFAIVGATLHPVDKKPIVGGTLWVEDGRIKKLGKSVETPAGLKTIDATGLHVFPGLIDAGTTLGLVEIKRVRETHDYSETGDMQPDLRAAVAVNPDSELIPVARAGGITTALIRPNGGIISGQASIIQLAGWTSEQMTLNLEAGLQIQWPRQGSTAVVKKLRDFLHEARFYETVRTAKKDDVLIDPRFEALRPYLARKKPVFVEANTRRQIAEVLEFAEKEKLKIVITGAADAWKLASELKKRNVPVIVGEVMRRPIEAFDPQDAPYANPGRLHEAGVKFCIRSNDTSNSRNTPFESAMAVAHGLPADVGLRAVTLSAAEILGIDKQVGSLTVGKLANLIVTDGSPLQITSQVKVVFIGGVPYRPESRQTRFYERYRGRLAEFKKQQQPESTVATPD